MLSLSRRCSLGPDLDERSSKRCLDAFGQVDVLICNAGILHDRTFANISEEDWDLVLKVHLKGKYCSTLPIWNWLRNNGRPGIIMTASTSGLFGKLGRANHGAAKAGIYGLLRVLSSEGRKYSIRVMRVAPNAITRTWANVPGVGESEPAPILRPENVAPGVLSELVPVV
ncbi:SDR family NAD(P)-dependent oxidoreductase [Bradyrhizobium sp. UFLA06-06]